MRYPAASSHISPSEVDAPDLNDPSSRPVPKTEHQPLQTPGSRFSGPVGSYGSIVASPRQHVESPDIRSLRLPDPAIDPNQDYVPSSENIGPRGLKNSSPVISRRVASAPPDATLTKVPTGHASSLHRETTPEDAGIPPEALGVSPNTLAAVNRTPQFIRRVFSYAEDPSPADPRREVEKRHSEFYAWLDDELKKIDNFYRKKEEEAKERYDILHRQLHVMSRNRQVEIKDARKAAEENGHHTPHRPKRLAALNAARLKDTLKETLMGRNLRIGKNSESLAQLETPGIRPRDREYMFDRREHMHTDSPTKDPGYRTAKHQLKIAMQEFYRGIDLLRGYANLNQTAFRKINKKFDKAVIAEKPLEYMTERVNKSHFVKSGETAKMMRKVEDWYGRYFEAGNTKIAATKLRSTTQKAGDYSSHTFRAGLFLMAGVLFSIQALVHAAQHLLHGDLTLQVHTSYLLQVRAVFALLRVPVSPTV